MNDSQMKDILDIVSGISGGVGKSIADSARSANTKSELKQLKKRTFGELLNRAMKRDMGLFRMGQEHADDTNDYQSQAIQDVARGFSDSLRGSTKAFRGR